MAKNVQKEPIDVQQIKRRRVIVTVQIDAIEIQNYETPSQNNPPRVRNDVRAQLN